MKETLTCTICGKDWKRDVTRGRKPKVCKKCFKQSLKISSASSSNTHSPDVASSSPKRSIKAAKVNENTTVSEPYSIADNSAVPSANLTIRQVWSMLHPKPTNWRELFQDTKGGSVWQCPKCKWIMHVSVPVTDIPTHKCTPLSKSSPLERVPS